MSEEMEKAIREMSRERRGDRSTKKTFRRGPASYATTNCIARPDPHAVPALQLHCALIGIVIPIAEFLPGALTEIAHIKEGSEDSENSTACMPKYRDARSARPGTI